jgi:transcriptional regulator with XRE-family HTH domain
VTAEVAGTAALRLRREARGLSVDEAAKATKIPVAHIDAIEAGRFDELPDGPYRAGLLRAYSAWLGVEPDPTVLRSLTAPPAPPLAAPVWTVRVLATALSAALAAALVWTFTAEWGATDHAALAPPPNAPDQHVALTARRTTHVKIVVDGEVVLDRAIPGGERVEVAGHRRVEVDLEGADAARVEYNGDLVVPQGRQDVPRRLVFVDDLDPGTP